MAEGTKKQSQGDESSFFGSSNRMYDATGEKNTLQIFYIPKNEKLRWIWENRVTKTVKPRQLWFAKSSKWHIACSRGESVNFKERSSPTKMEWTTQGRRGKEKKSSRTTRNVTECKQGTAKKLERRSPSQTVVDDVRDSTVRKCERRFTPYLRF